MMEQLDFFGTAWEAISSNFIGWCGCMFDKLKGVFFDNLEWLVGYIADLLPSAFKKFGRDITANWKLLKSSLKPNYQSCNMNMNIAKDDLIETKSKMNINIIHNFARPKNYYVYFISIKSMLDNKNLSLEENEAYGTYKKYQKGDTYDKIKKNYWFKKDFE